MTAFEMGVLDVPDVAAPAASFLVQMNCRSGQSSRAYLNAPPRLRIELQIAAYVRVGRSVRRETVFAQRCAAIASLPLRAPVIASAAGSRLHHGYEDSARISARSRRASRRRRRAARK